MRLILTWVTLGDLKDCFAPKMCGLYSFELLDTSAYDSHSQASNPSMGFHSLPHISPSSSNSRGPCCRDMVRPWLSLKRVCDKVHLKHTVKKYVLRSQRDVKHKEIIRTCHKRKVIVGYGCRDWHSVNVKIGNSNSSSDVLPNTNTHEKCWPWTTCSDAKQGEELKSNRDELLLDD